jgi:hypothetical protein
MGAGMSIRHGAWVFCVPWSLKIEYPQNPECICTPVRGKRDRKPKKANFRTNLDFSMKTAFFAKRRT